jgi:hypothetical protein
VRPAPSLLRAGATEGLPTEFFSGVCRRGDEMIFVVSLDALLDPAAGRGQGAGE